MHLLFQVPYIPGIVMSDVSRYHAFHIASTSHSRYHASQVYSALRRSHSFQIPHNLHTTYPVSQIPCIPGTMHHAFQVPCIPGIVSSQKLPDTCIPGTMHHAFQLPSTPGPSHLGSEAIFKLRNVLTRYKNITVTNYRLTKASNSHPFRGEFSLFIMKSIRKT